MADGPSRRLRLLRFRPGTTVEDVLRPDRMLEVAASSALPPGSRVFITDPERPPSVPSWLPFVQGASSDALSGLESTLSGALIFVQRAGSLWALTFGTAHLFVREDAAVPRFGLRTVLNIVDADRLRFMGTRVHEDVVIRTSREVSRRQPPETFSIDDTRDILREVVGAPRDRTKWGTEVTGSTALTLSVPLDVSELGELIDELAAAHSLETYKERFAFVDYIDPVRDEATRTKLDELLMAAVKGELQANVYLAPPEPIQYDDVAGFLFFREHLGAEHQELELRDYLASLDNANTLTLEDLHKHEIRLVARSTGLAVRAWAVYRCLIFEASLDDRLYVLSEGEWFGLKRDFVATVNQAVGRIAQPALDLPNAGYGEPEADYNRRAASELDIALLDKRLIPLGGTTIEVADLVTDAGLLVHVKRKTQSATLSHLFAQGRVSGEAMKADPDARAAARGLLTSDGRREAAVFAEPFLAHDKTVVFAVLADNAGDLPGALPFFSRLNLWQAVRFLSGTLDYQVAFVGVPFV